MLVAFSLPGKVAWSFTPAHPLWGIDQAAHEPERLAGPVSGIWLLIFSLPLFLFTPDRPSSRMPLLQAALAGVSNVVRTIKSLRHYRNIGAYLLARPFFNSWPEIIFRLIVNFIAVLITAGYANSRTMLARIAPPEKMTEFFGLYSLSGTSTTFLATGFVSLLTALSHNQRIGLLGET